MNKLGVLGVTIALLFLAVSVLTIGLGVQAHHQCKRVLRSNLGEERWPIAF